MTQSISMPDIKLLPSLLSADFANLGADAAAAEQARVDGLHCDIMDGHFVPNITFGPMVVKAVGAVTNLPLFCHLMIERPELYIEDFAKAGAAEILVHPEVCVHLHRVLQQIKALGVKAGVALNPSTPLCAIEHVITDIDVLLIMTVNPGFGGQSFIETMLPKIYQARQMAMEHNVGLDIAVDGGIDVDTTPRVVRAGANVLVAGTAIFGNSLPIKEACDALRFAARTAFESEMV